MAFIRLARQEDLAAVVTLTQQWAVEPPPSTTGHYAYNTEEQLEPHLGQYFWVAEEEGEAVGFLLGSRNGDGSRSMHYQVLEKGEDHLSLDQVYVHPDWRNHGIGSQLVACFRAAAEEAGVSCCLLLSQNADWTQTLRFYQKNGFRPWFFTMFTGRSTEERRGDAE